MLQVGTNLYVHTEITCAALQKLKHRVKVHEDA